MSSNGTYVLQTYGPEWRVAQVEEVGVLFEEQDLETLKWTPNVDAIVGAFKESKVFDNFEDAWDHATNLEHEKETKLGVALIREFKTMRYSEIQSQYIKNHNA
jgi:hypothetical protein